MELEVRSGCRLAVRLADGRHGVDLIRQVRGPPLGADGLPSFGVVARDGVLTDLLETGHRRLLTLELLCVELHLHQVRAGGLRVGGDELVQIGLCFGQLEVLRLDGGVGVLEEGLGTDPAVGIIALLYDLAGAAHATGGDADAPASDWQDDDGRNEDPDPRLDAARGPSIDLVVPLLFDGFGHVWFTPEFSRYFQ